MKMRIRKCEPKKEAKIKEPELEFWLEEYSESIQLKVKDVANNVAHCNSVLTIYKKTGVLRRTLGLNPAFGLPLDPSGRIKLGE